MDILLLPKPREDEDEAKDEGQGRMGNLLSLDVHQIAVPAGTGADRCN